MGAKEVYVESGSKVLMECKISAGIESPAYIFWWRGNERVLEYQTSNVVMKIEKLNPSTTIATLMLKKITPQLTGNYTCAPANLHRASVSVNVINGKS